MFTPIGWVGGWIVASIAMYHLLTPVPKPGPHFGRGRDGRDRIHSEMAHLASQYIQECPAKFSKRDLDNAVRIASQQRVSRGATAIVQVIGGRVYVDRAAFTSPYVWDRMRLQFVLARLSEIAGRWGNVGGGDFEFIVNVHDCPLRLPSEEEQQAFRRVPIFTMTKCRGMKSIPLPQWNRQRDGQWAEWDGELQRLLRLRNRMGARRTGHEQSDSDDDDNDGATGAKPSDHGDQRQAKAIFRGAFRSSVLQYSEEEGRLRFVDLTNASSSGTAAAANNATGNWRRWGRGRLVLLAAQRPDLLNVGVQTASSDEWRLIAGDADARRANNGTQLSMEEQARLFRYAVNVEGACGWADRLKRWLAMGQIVLQQDTPCHEFFHPLLKPGVHYVPLANDLGNLIESIEQLNASPADGQFIEQSALYWAGRFLSRTAWEDYIEAVFLQYRRRFFADGLIQVKRRPGTVRFLREARCAPAQKAFCDDSAAFQSE